MIPKFRAWQKTWEEMGWIACIRYKKSGEIARLSFRRNINDGNIYGGLVNLDEIELMQSTGLKDKNGKEIFEGDILKSNKYITSVFYEDGAYCVKFRRTPNTTVTMNVISFIEKYKTKVIGNIYENPEFVKDKEVDN